LRPNAVTQPTIPASSSLPQTSDAAKKLVETYVSRTKPDGQDTFHKLFEPVYSNGPKGLFDLAKRPTADDERQKVVRRICSVAFVQWREKGMSIDDIASEIDGKILATERTGKEVTKLLSVGNQWLAIIQSFALVVGKDTKQLTGLLCVFSASLT
jgi:hypothetical protein